jgi:hypothetical protein
VHQDHVENALRVEGLGEGSPDDVEFLDELPLLLLTVVALRVVDYGCQMASYGMQGAKASGLTVSALDRPDMEQTDNLIVDLQRHGYCPR